MRKLQLLFTAAAALLSSAAAQEASETMSMTSRVSTRPAATTTSSSASSTSSSTGTATHTVSVGLDHRYIPDTIEAEVGDIINFRFYGANHSVVKAEFGQPCVPYDMIHPGEESFFSGAIEQPDGNENPLPTWTLRVNTTEPVFFYCSAPESCITWKMIGVINPNRTRTREEQVEFVTNGTTTFQLSPGEPFPAEGEPPSGEDSYDDPAYSPPPTDDSSEGSSESSSEDSSEGGGGLAPGAIAGIAIGGAAVIIFAVALVYVCGRKGGIEKGYRRSRVSPSATAAAPPSMIEAHYQDDHNLSHSPYYGVGGGLPPKSPPPPSTHTSSIYGGMPNSGTFAPDPYRSRSPNQLSEIGSPHTSYISGHPSPGFVPPGFGSPRLNQGSMSPPPAELEAHSEPRRELS
ncbi:hypothetical protein DL764_006412 [Monosporascus ibericus]|uniref:Blue (type 1) copper domain-containing protein n=1 Tax=Monosporascus ibericus TaxID=155417 RepID=A0A4Q4T4V2_9PEZI|nr:hypothetical protein DL764_006412 [Monosporascus ibericus]